jgi:30S ribosomal protein S31
MGKGDKKTRRGKIFKGSYGKSRPHSVKKKAATRAKPGSKKG